ncbi:MAG: hypothetical protein QOH81_2557 [Sphingomonadales bacterium]|jgi:ABC-type multidrug transport system permease subunit|nr:hypothetical protein [Sphingomonadales bacterium]
MIGAAAVVMGVILLVWCLRDGEAAISVNFRHFHRATHPKAFWTLIVFYAAMVLFGVIALISN